MADDKTPVIRRTNSVFSGAGAPSPWGLGDPVENRRADQDSLRRAGIPIQDDEDEKKKAREKRKKESRDRRDRIAVSSARAAASSQQIYVDGRLVTTYNLFDEDGNPVQIQTLGGYRTDGETAPVFEDAMTLSAGQRREIESRMSNRKETFSILGMAEMDGQADARFIYSKGMQLDEDGKGWYDNPRGQEMEEQRLMRGQNPHSDNRTNATNMMTLAGGVTAFRQLSKNDPEAFNELLDMLVKAKYLDPADARKNMYNLDAGRAFAKAAAEASENFKAGGDEDFLTFLRKMAGSAAEAEDAQKKAAYEPVDRQYTDPEYLAANARAAAEELLGRGLSDEEVARFNSRFRGLEDKKYDGIDAAGRSEGTARVVDPNPTGQAEAFVRSDEFSGDRAKQLTGNYMDALMELLK